MSEHRVGDTKYTPLVRYLQALPTEQRTVTLSLAEITAIIGAPLPPSVGTAGFWGGGAAIPLLNRAGWRASLPRGRDVVTFRRR